MCPEGMGVLFAHGWHCPTIEMSSTVEETVARFAWKESPSSSSNVKKRKLLTHLLTWDRVTGFAKIAATFSESVVAPRKYEIVTCPSR